MLVDSHCHLDFARVRRMAELVGLPSHPEVAVAS